MVPKKKSFINMYFCSYLNEVHKLINLCQEVKVTEYILFGWLGKLCVNDKEIITILIQFGSKKKFYIERYEERGEVSLDDRNKRTFLMLKQGFRLVNWSFLCKIQNFQ